MPTADGPRRPDPLAHLRRPGDPACDAHLTGTVFLDIVFTGLDGAPVRGTETWARGMGSCPGGVANMATALARLGLRTRLAAAFGDDRYGEYCWETLERDEGIDLSPSRVLAGWHSPVTVSMAYEGERTMVSHGHLAPLSPTAPTGGRAPDPARSCVASLAPGEPQEWIARAAGAGSVVFADTGWDETGRWDLSSLDGLAHCAAFLPNAEEAMRYTRTDSPHRAVRALAEHVPLAVVTMGARGAVAADAGTGELVEVPALPVTVLDPTGAGDVFMAGFVTGTLAGWPPADRLAFAALTAGLSVQEFGGSLSAPCWDQIAAWRRRTLRAGGAPARYDFLDALIVDIEPGAGGGPGDGTRTDGPVPGRPLRRAVPTLGFGDHSH
ncbi:PfkB family carbohydrate kinase [Streptomyces sp. ST2-7A]|uniref:carbohydrate kinase family protein n=1 Tax=Streptomyces sp. ST2-7A TaxID=2907214 RepID=UPI001F27C4B2|nr:PfkB family carbohydrate kinase [Streptomyces sp. ST2-7A]MCE7079163.1 PfkB family carbohydrate kinase [Streptomyces sp. ST2-7A]